MNVQLDAIAARSGYGRRALELIFNRTTGMPPGRWFMNIRLNGALRDLLEGAPGCNIADVASRWGFRHFPLLPISITVLSANCRVKPYAVNADSLLPQKHPF
ncbi:helix-turn-helix domain-containing protein [Pseudomonas asiatica]|uniref:helix-turn-helix domain-containing protein n=1 Tax=Pseudomonas asiatica TaxID=2219225 RepID=UPI0037CB737C